jgi:hypothetical protein
VSARLLRAGAVVAVLAATVGLVIHLVNVFAFDRRYYQLDASGEDTVFAWANAMMTFAAALGALAWGTFEHVVRSRALPLAAILAYFSLDELVEIHERLGDALSNRAGLPEAVGPRAWIAVYIPLLAVTTLLLWSMLRHTDARNRRQQLTGLGFLVAAVASEGVGVITKELEERGNGSPHLVRAGIEEALEMAGWSLIAAAMFAAAYAVIERDAVLSGKSRNRSP